MFVYIGIFLFLAALALQTYDKRPNLAAVRAVLIMLTLFVGTRMDVGCDFQTYDEKLKTIGLQTASFTFEKVIQGDEFGFILFSRLFSDFGLGIFWQNLAVAAVFFLGLEILLRRVAKPFAFLAVLYPILIVGLAMSGLRQAAACGFLMMALAFYIDKRPIKFVIAILIGFTFHASLIVFLPLAWTINKAFSFRSLVIGFVLAAPVVAYLMGSRIQLYEERYIDSELEAYGAIYRSIIISVPAYAYMLINLLYKGPKPKFDNITIISLLASLLLLPVSMYSSVAGERLGQYVVVLSAILLINVTVALHKRNTSPLILVGYLLVLLVYQVGWFSLSYHADVCYLPYQSYLIESL